MENIFEKYYMFKYDNGVMVGVNNEAFELSDESFSLFKELYNTFYGSIDEEDNLISIHTGGWSENEELIEEFQKTFWWFRFHKITATGGHYYFNTDFHGKKEWVVTVNNK